MTWESNVLREDGKEHVCCFCQELTRKFICAAVPHPGLQTPADIAALMREYKDKYLLLCEDCHRLPKDEKYGLLTIWIMCDQAKQRQEPYFSMVVRIIRKGIQKSKRRRWRHLHPRYQPMLNDVIDVLHINPNTGAMP